RTPIPVNAEDLRRRAVGQLASDLLNELSASKQILIRGIVIVNGAMCGHAIWTYRVANPPTRPNLVPRALALAVAHPRQVQSFEFGPFQAQEFLAKRGWMARRVPIESPGRFAACWTVDSWGQSQRGQSMPFDILPIRPP